MSSNQQTPSDPSPQNVSAQGTAVEDLSKREIGLVTLYQKLTGEEESQARNAFMYTFRDDMEFNVDGKT